MFIFAVSIHTQVIGFSYFMGWLANILNWVKRESSEKSDSSHERTPRTGYPWLSTEHGALCVSSVFRCVRLLSESVANLPLQYQRMRGGIFIDDTSSRMHYLLTVQPNPAMNAFDFWASAIQHVLLDGNAYIFPVYYRGELNALFLCSRGTVSCDAATDTYTITDYINGIKGVYRENDVIHLKGRFTSYDGKTGLSVLSHARLTTAIATTGSTETLNRFENGGAVRGLLGKSDKVVSGFGDYQTEQLKRLAKETDDKIQAGQRIIAIPGDLDFQQFSLSSTDMQFLETRKFEVREICRFFGVHPSFVYDDASNNYKSAEMANVEFLSNTLNPMLKQIEAELHRKLIPESLCCKYRFLFDRFELYACDLESKAKYLGNMLATGLYTVNELRKMENRPAVPHGDRAFVSANLKGVDESNTVQQNNNTDNDKQRAEEKGKE